MDILKVIKMFIEVIKEDGVNGIVRYSFIISCSVLFFSPVTLLFTLYRDNILNHSIALIVIISSILFIILYFLSSIVIPFIYLIKCIRTGNYNEMDARHSKVDTFIMTMICYLILSIILIVGYLVIRFKKFSIMGQAGTKLFLISIMIVSALLIFMWLFTILSKKGAHRRTKKYTDKAEEIKKNTNEIYDDMSKLN